MIKEYKIYNWYLKILDFKVFLLQNEADIGNVHFVGKSFLIIVLIAPNLTVRSLVIVKRGSSFLHTGSCKLANWILGQWVFLFMFSVYNNFPLGGNVLQHPTDLLFLYILLIQRLVFSRKLGHIRAHRAF